MKTSVEKIGLMMRMAALVLVGLLVTFQSFGQEKDTTKIKLGNKKVIIIDSKGKDKLEKGKMEFKAEILELDTKISDLKKQKAENASNTEKVAEIDKEIATLENKKAALEKGIADIDNEMNSTEKENHEDGKEKDEDEDFDWKFGKKLWHKKHKNEMDGHWAGFELGLNNFVNKDNKMELPSDGQFMELNSSKSWNFTFNFYEKTIPLYKNNIGLVTGMGIEWNNFNLKKNVTLLENTSGVIYGDAAFRGVEKFKKNKFRLVHFNVPLLLEFQFPLGDNRLHISGGVVGGIKLDSDLKQEYTKDGRDFVDVMDDDFQMNVFRYGATVRIGYGALRLYANYELSPLFKTNHGPVLYPFTVGLTLLDF